MSASLADAQISQTFDGHEHNEASRLDSESPRMTSSTSLSNIATRGPPEFREKEGEPTTTSESVTGSTSNHDADADAGAVEMEKGSSEQPRAYSVFTRREKWLIVVAIAFAGLLRWDFLFLHSSCHHR